MDPTNVQHILASDFHSFNHRGITISKDDLLADNILLMNGNRWKLVRQNLTPLFTSTKLRAMYYIIDKSAIDFMELLKSKPELLKGDVFDTLSSFCSAAIGAAVFGVDICVTLQKNGKLIDKESGLELEPTDELLAAQAFFFFIAGVEPTATAIFATLVELGRHPEYLEKVQNEIDEAFIKNDSKMSYDIVSNMSFLDMAFNEAMRMHPPIGFLTRECVRDTVLPVGNIKVDKGTRVFTPLFEYHHNEKHYEDPEVFKPERFSPENKHKIADISFMPFGKGNRVCVGMRYATLQAKTGLIYLLRNFTVNTIIKPGGMRYSKQQVQVRLDNVDIEISPRTPRC
ncbi:unnamed protein product [Leptosia nina]|uniref:unspecific monooxygenase n=1 Tax=Leptosia nina TaxID=320188 RepID=A0AAV1JUN2_9NEOP